MDDILDTHDLENLGPPDGKPRTTILPLTGRLLIVIAPGSRFLFLDGIKIAKEVRGEWVPLRGYEVRAGTDFDDDGEEDETFVIVKDGWPIDCRV